MTDATPPTKPVKAKGPIRWEAIIPFSIFCLVTGLYFHFFFDLHLRKGLEWAGYQAVGAEVNIASLETRFLSASLKIKKIEVTDAEKPTHNSLKIGEIRFSMGWDALLRAKILINEAVIEQIEFGVARAKPGKVKPPEPPSTDPSLTDKLKAQALAEAQGAAGDNVLGDVIAMLGGADAQTQLDKLQNSLPSKALLEKFDADLKAKQQAWDAKLKSLPQGKDIQALNDRLNKVKYKDFKSPQELQSSLQELDRLFKDGDAMYKQVQSTGDEMSKDLKNIESQYKEIEKQIRADISALEQHFRIPKLDAKAMTMAVFNRYLAPYKSKFYRYKELATKYVPPNLMNKNNANADEIIQPHPREEGISYEFGRKNSYPLFWIKRTAVSSQAGATPEAGNIRGEILDITSNQRITQKPTVASLAGDFPAKEILGFLIKVSVDNSQELSEIDYRFTVSSYPISGRPLVETPDVKLAFAKATGSFALDGTVVGLKEITLNLQNRFTKIDYAISSTNEIADQILKGVFAGIPTVDLNVTGKGEFPNIPFSVNSNLGPELQKGFERQIQAKIDEARKRIEAMIQEEIGKQKALVEAQLTQLRGELDREVKKAQAQLEDQKKQIEARVDQAKKDTEARAEQAKKDAENQARKQLEKEGKKAVDDLKSKFGL